MRLFFLDQPTEPGNLVVLNKEQSHRLLYVLRMQIGSQFAARDAQRSLYTVQISEIKNKLVILNIVEKKYYTSPWPQIILWQAMPKHPRFAQTVQLAVEAGVSRIVPIISEYSQVSKESCLDKLQRWNRVAIEAIDQSGNRDFYQIDPIINLDRALCEAQPGLGFFCHQDSLKQNPLRQILHQANRQEPIILAIGPEGGFSEREVQAFQQASFRSICFHQTILRSENAGFFFLAALKMTLQEIEESYGEITRRTH